MQALRDFVKESLSGNGKTNKEIFIGNINKSAQNRIKKQFGYEVGVISTDSSGIRHAYEKTEHNLDPEDILIAVDVINTSIDIEKSDKKHRSNPVLLFKKDIKGEITFMAEVRVGKRKLTVANFWRKKKARQSRTDNSPAADVQNERSGQRPIQGTSALSSESGEKSSPRRPPLCGKEEEA